MKNMGFELFLENDFSDKDFDSLFSPKIGSLSSRHWTPVSIVRQVVDFLIASNESKVLDIGSGAGKFCLVGALYKEANFFGVEKRTFLVRSSNKLAEKLRLENKVHFINESIENIDFKHFDAFYFFNSFHENLDSVDPIDSGNTIDEKVYEKYTLYVKEQLGLRPKGTKIVTYCSGSKEIPNSYRLVRSAAKGKLLFWEKNG